MFKKSILLIASLIFLNSTIVAKEDSLQIINQIKLEAQKGPLPKEKEEKYTKQLRSLYVKKEHIWDVMMAFQEINANIRRQFSEISDEECKEAHNSIGVILNTKGKTELALTTLIREAKCLVTSAQIMLKIIYRYPSDYRIYDMRILECFKEMALEGLHRSQFDYGQSLLNGWGVEPNIKEGLYYLELAAEYLSEANMEIASYYLQHNNEISAEKYLRKAADQDSAQGTYNLAIFEQRRKNYHKAVALLTKTLALDPEYHNAKLELGRMYIDGWGVDKDQKKGFELIKEVAEKTQDLETKAIAYMNLGIFYQRGIGVKKSVRRARRYFEKAQALGHPDAEKYLENLNDIYTQPKD